MRAVSREQYQLRWWLKTGLFVGLLFGCAVSRVPTAYAESERQVLACPSSVFVNFLKRFSDDVQLQRRYTRNPLVYYEYVNADPEPVLHKRTLADEQRKFPVVPLAAQRRQQNLKLTILKQSADSAMVELSKPDTDYWVTYLFVKRNCWQLVEERNLSL